MTNKAEIKVGDDVTWSWGKGHGDGEVVQVHTDDVEKRIKGSKIKRKASASEPAVEIKTDKGGKVLKSTTEVKIRR